MTRAEESSEELRQVGGPLDGATEKVPEKEIPASGSWRTIAVRDRKASEMIAGRLLERDGLQYLYSFISEGSSSGRMIFEGQPGPPAA